MVKHEALCDEHAATQPYMVKTETGFIWTLRDETKNGDKCHCGKPSSWLRVISVKDDTDAA